MRIRRIVSPLPSFAVCPIWGTWILWRWTAVWPCCSWWVYFQHFWLHLGCQWTSEKIACNKVGKQRQWTIHPHTVPWLLIFWGQRRMWIEWKLPRLEVRDKFSQATCPLPSHLVYFIIMVTSPFEQLCYARLFILLCTLIPEIGSFLLGNYAKVWCAAKHHWRQVHPGRALRTPDHPKLLVAGALEQEAKKQWKPYPYAKVVRLKLIVKEHLCQK